MDLIKLVTLLLLKPLTAVSNALTPKDHIIEVQLTFSNTVCSIKTEAKSGYSRDELLLSAFLMFISKYLYICDDRQTEPVKNVLRKIPNYSEKSTIAFGEAIYKTAFLTLSEAEQKAVMGLFFMGIPPLTFSEDDKVNYKMAEYTIRISPKLAIYFLMSAGPDIILLPLTLANLYEYVMEKIEDKKKKDLAVELTKQLLEGYDTVNCKSNEGLMLARDLLLKNGIF